MKILIIGNGSIGNDENKRFFINKHTGNFLKEVNLKHSVTYAEGETKYCKNNNLQNFNLKENGIKFETLDSPKSPKSILKAFKLIRKKDFVYLFYPGSQSKLYGLLSIILKRKFGLYIRGQYYNQGRIDRFILNHASTILTVSPSIQKDVKVFCKDTRVIKPMISITKENINYTRKYNFENSLKILFVGRVEERKGIIELLNVASNLKKSGLNFKITIVGGGDLFQTISDRKKILDIDEEVNLVGLISDTSELTQLYNNSDVFLFTSHDEGFPRVLYEAMASGLPIFTTFVGGISGRMIDRENCIEIPVKNSTRTTEILIKEIKNYKTLQKIGKNGIQTMEQIIDGKLKSHAETLINTLIK